MSAAKVMLRNGAFLLAGNLATWAVSLLFWLVLPRLVGPNSWGEFSLGVAIAGLAFSVGALGIPTFIVKQIARDREHSSDYLGASLGTNLALSILILAGVLIFTLLARYSPHTRAVVLLLTGVTMCTFMVAPAVSVLQALERMHLNVLILSVRQIIATFALVSVAVIFRPDIIVLIVIILTANVVASLFQLAITHRDVAIRVSFDRTLSRWLITNGLPFWSNGLFLTIYAWIDSVLLSLLASTREVGYYAAPVQIIATLGFLPAIVTTVIFPNLSRGYHIDLAGMRRLTRLSLSGLVSLGLPISIGAALVGPRAIERLFGPAYGPSRTVILILALTVLPSYIATLAYWVLAAADRQRRWAYVMGCAAIANPMINLIAIPYFQSRFGHGAIGAAIALLITDVAVCVAGLSLIPRDCFRPAGPLVAMVARAAISTTVMAIPVWLLRDTFLPLQVLAGVGAFAGAALALGVFRGDGYDEAWSLLKAKVGQRLWRRSEIDVPA